MMNISVYILYFNKQEEMKLQLISIISFIYY